MYVQGGGWNLRFQLCRGCWRHAIETHGGDPYGDEDGVEEMRKKRYMSRTVSDILQGAILTTAGLWTIGLTAIVISFVYRK